ncbi:MAG: right-handed parallel beta-helix repeat-containing protein [Candidatus Lokiarchaeota archaeon]|nr:right-handed parallel beta-helix repeat-containing protein [Candidatus Lokiarchaeota archaeon]
MSKKVIKMSLLLVALSLAIIIPVFALSVSAKKEGYTSGPVYINDAYSWASWEYWSSQPWLEGSGTEEDPYMIKDFVIDVTGSQFAMMIQDSNAHFKIMKCKFSNGGIEGERTAGLILVNVENGVIFKNTFTNNDGAGIAVSGCLNIRIQKNFCSENGIGIYIEWGMYTSIKQNDCSNNLDSGIVIASAHKNIIEKNECNGNVGAGIALINIGELDHSPKDNIIYANNFEENNAGIYSDDADINDVLRNTVAGNFYGILFGSGSEGNLVYHNNFIDNAVQLVDFQPWANNWHHPYMFEGNFWSNYLGLDENEDGIGDAPHGNDGYPIMEENSWEILSSIEEEISNPQLPNSLGGDRMVNPNETSYIRAGVLQLFSERMNGEAYPPYEVRINGALILNSVWIFQEETASDEPGLMQLFYVKFPPYYLNEVMGLTPGYYEYYIEISWYNSVELIVIGFTTGFTLL